MVERKHGGSLPGRAGAELSHELHHDYTARDCEADATEEEAPHVEEVTPADGSELQKNELAKIPITLKVEAAARNAVRRMFINADD